MKLYPRSFLLPLGVLIALWFASVAFAQTVPVITVQPQARTVTVGAAATFSVVASGNPPVAYQWRKNGQPITGATAASYVTPPTVALDNASQFAVTVSNPTGSVSSVTVVLTVNPRAVVEIQGPSGVAAGQTVTFTAAATGGTPPFTYQWYRTAITPANLIAGATGSTYVTPLVTVPGDDYFVRITDSSGIVVDSPAKSLFVFAADQTITFNPPANAVVSPTPLPLTATASSGLAVTFSLTATPIAVLAGSNLTFNAPGTVTVRATQAGNTNFKSEFVERQITVAKGTPVITWANPNPVYDGTPLTAVQLNATANVPGAFVYDPVGGTIMRAGTRTLSVTFTPTDATGYNPVTVTRSLVVAAAPVVSGPPGGGVAAGQTATFNVAAAGGFPPLRYQWYKNGDAPANLIPGATNATYTTPLLTVADNGSNYRVRITDGNNIVTTTSPSSLTVFPADQTITFAAPVNPVVSPTPLSLAASASSGLPVTLTRVSGPATLAGTALTLTGIGSVTLRATQAGSADFNPAPAIERTFVVNKGTPVITWTVPAAVPSGTVLSSAQLNATANVPGTFVYNPAAGAVVTGSSLVVNATFTPTDTTNYNAATAQRTLVVAATEDPARLTNVSVRTTLPAAQTLIVGFTMQGGAKPVLLRAVGPGLNQFAVSGTMSDPRLELFSSSGAVEANDNWGGSLALSAAFASVGAFGLPANSLDAALVRLIEGGHTAQINGPAGTVLVEVYDSGSGASPRLTNVSARNRAGTGSDILIAGFTIGGTGQRNLLIRGVGPTLTSLGVQGVLTDPKLEVYSGSTKIAENDTWPATLAPTFASVGAFGLTAGSRDAALTVALGPGSYTVQVLGADGGTGEAVVELYELP